MWVLLTTLFDPHSISDDMPPLRPVFKRCKCEECIHKSPDGISMDSRLIPAHLKRVQEESKISLTVIQKSPHDSHPDDIAGHLFALTLTDDGPDLKSSASKLWNSRAEYQESSATRRTVGDTIEAQELCRMAMAITNWLYRGVINSHKETWILYLVRQHTFQKIMACVPCSSGRSCDPTPSRSDE